LALESKVINNGLTSESFAVGSIEEKGNQLPMKERSIG
jgi:hypothetical protein